MDNPDDEKDPDLNGDPDLSLNYKTIGGNVARRWLEGKSLDKRVPAWNKKDKERVLVSPETLRSKSDIYEPYKDQGGDEGGDTEKPDHSKALDELEAKDPSLKGILEGISDTTNPFSDGSKAKARPELKLENVYPGTAFPPGVETLGDLQEAVLNRPKPKPAPEPTPEPKPTLEPKPEPKPEPTPEAKPEQPAKPEKAEKPEPEQPEEQPAKPEKPEQETPEAEAPKEEVDRFDVPSKEPEPEQSTEPKPKPEEKAPEPEKEAPAKEPEPEKAPEEAKPEPQPEPQPEPKPKAKPEQAKKEHVQTKAWVDGGAVESKEFAEFADSDRTVSTDPDGSLLFVNESKEKVPFAELSPEMQTEWRKKFEQQSRSTGHSKVLRDLGKKDPEVRKVLEDLADPESELSKRLLEEKDIELADPAKLIPELKGKLPKDLHSMGDLLSVATGMFKAPVKRKPPSEQEQAKTTQMLTDNLPAHMLRGFFDQDMHPEEAKAVIEQYEQLKKESSEWSDLEQDTFLEKAGEEYQTNPGKISPPKTVLKGGKEVPYEKLPPQEQAEAWRVHQQQTAMKSLVAQMLVSQRFSDVGNDDVARTIATFHLKKNQGQSDEQRAQEAAKEGDRLFTEVISQGPTKTPLTNKAVNGILDHLEGDPAAQSLAAAALQARDYQSAKQKFLGPQGVSEHDSPETISTGLVRAGEWLEERADQYPEDSRGRNVARLFQQRVLDRLKTLTPEKYEKVKARLDKHESTVLPKKTKQYEKAKKQYEKALKKYEVEVAKVRKENEVTKKEYQDKLKAQEGGYRETGGKKPPKPKLKEPPPKPEAPKPPRSKSSFTYSMGLEMKRALYHGVEPEAVEPYPDWRQVSQHDLTLADQETILSASQEWLKEPTMKATEGTVRDAQLRAVLDFAIATTNGGAYARAVHPSLYNSLLAQLAGFPEGETLVTIRESSQQQSFDDDGHVGRQPATIRSEDMSTPKVSAETKQATDLILNRIDRVAKTIQAKQEEWGIPFEDAKAIVNALDRSLDDIEITTYGKESFELRQAEVIKREGDEPYMDTFNGPSDPKQTDADEPYMRAYADDDTSGVIHGESTTGRPLAPGHK